MTTIFRTPPRAEGCRSAGPDRPATLPPNGHRSSAPAPRGARTAATRAPYTPPRLESLGAWSALTLQQSVPIGPGNF